MYTPKGRFAEISAVVHMVRARLDSDPRTSKEWRIIAKHLADASHEASKLSAAVARVEKIVVKP